MELCRWVFCVLLLIASSLRVGAEQLRRGQRTERISGWLFSSPPPSSLMGFLSSLNSLLHHMGLIIQS